MQYEVEQKFPVANMHTLQERLIALGITIGEVQIEVDLYFTHPARDFAKTDEALRIRRKGRDCTNFQGDCPNFPKENGTVPFMQSNFPKENGTVPLGAMRTKNFITYKGPKIDATTKTRREIELPLPEGEESFRAWSGLLEALGFKPFREVRKSRRKAKITWQGREIECSLDHVEGLGNFCELELLADQAGLEPAKSSIASLAAELGLKQSERRSYLELLLEAGDRRL